SEKQGILSPLTNSEKKKLRSLLTKKGRELTRQFTAEGVRLLEESIRHQQLPQKLYYCQSRLNARSKQLLAAFGKLEVPVQSVTFSEMEKISDTAANQGLLGLFNIPQSNIKEIPKNNSKTILLLNSISDPGNEGTLIRSALAFGLELILTTSDTVEPFNPKVVRASAGAIFGIPIISVSNTSILQLKEEYKLVILAADIKGKTIESCLTQLDPLANILLCIGSEASGLSEAIAAMADFKLKIPHEDKVESLNAAVAGSILMRELYKIRTKNVQ
ncbi:MAG: RNA methyltransferase, partial [candidate division Zixibacteria bacterium]|nr:RNA methyltransferase [candidate division Zixibacteria bacterium]